MKYIISILILLSTISFLSYSQQTKDFPTVPIPNLDTTAGIVSDNGVLYGTELDQINPNVLLTELFANPSQYENKIINIKGDIADVCQNMGCWSNITDGTITILVQTLHKFFLPKDASGGVSADGTFKLKEISEEHAKEMLKESKNPKMKEEDIKGPQKTFILEATSIRVYSK
jgi:hypothetical protein